MNSRTSVFLPLMISAAVVLSMLSLAPLLTTPVVSPPLLLAAGVPGLVAALTALLRLRRSWSVMLAALSGTGLLVWLGTSAAPLAGVPGLLTNGFQVLRESQPPLPDHPALGWLLLFFTFFLWLVSYVLAEALEQPAWVLAPLALPYGIAALVHPTDLDATGFLLVAGGYVAVLLTAGGPGLTGGGARFHLARWAVGLIAATVATALTLCITSVLPMGRKQPWLNNGTDRPIQLSDPTIELSRNLQRPSPVDVLTYRASDGRPHYLRTTALTHLTAEGAQLESMRLRNSGISEAYDAPGEQIDVNVSMRFPSQYLPAPFAVDGFDAAGNWGFDQKTLSVVATGDQGAEQTTNLDYRVTSVVPGGGASLPDARAGSDPAGDETRKVPEGVSDAVRDLADRITADKATDGAKAQAIEEYLNSDRFTYTLQAPSSTGTDAISAFLLNDHSGYCIHFATSMAILARIEGIPSRVAVGFTGGVPDGGGYKVTTDNMHAWPELYFEGLGWIPFEPTRSIGSPSSDENAPSTAPDSPPSTPPPSAGPPSETQPAEPSPSPVTPSASPNARTPGAGEGGSGNGGWLAWILPALLLVAAPAVTRLCLRGWRLRGGQAPPAAATAAWRELGAIHQDLGQDFPQGSPVEVAKTLGAALPETTATHLLELAETVQRCQFARDAPPVDRLANQVALLARELRHTLSGPRRLLAFLLPASLWRPRRAGNERSGRKSR